MVSFVVLFGLVIWWLGGPDAPEWYSWVLLAIMIALLVLFFPDRPSSIYDVTLPPLPFTASQPTRPSLVAGDQKLWLGWLFMAAVIVVALLAGWALAAFMAWLFPSLLGPVPY